MATVMGRARAETAQASASPDGASCGAFVTHDLTLTRDLICSGTALVLGSGVTLDLDGHRIAGEVFAGGDDVTMRNGTVEGPIDYGSCDRCLLERLTIRGVNDFAVELGTDNLVTRCRFVDNAIGLSSFFGQGGNVVVSSRFEGNSTGLVIGGNSGNLVTHNRFRDNLQGVFVWDEDEVESSDNRISANVFFANTVGAHMQALVEAHDNRFERNLFVSNGASGLVIEVGCGGLGCGGTGSRASRNLLIANGFRPIELSDLPDNRIVYEGPVVLDDGLTLPGRPEDHAFVSVRGNKAFANADLGIEAPGVVDDGGNVAAGNSDARQCAGVTCR